MKLRILSTSDVHGYLYPTNYSSRTNQQGYGFLKIATKIEQLKNAANPDDWVICIENGDFIQGSPLTYYTAKQAPRWRSIYTALTNAVGFDAGILGNHEFNYGMDYLADCEAGRNYPILNANFKAPAGSDIINAPYRILEKQGVKVGILGLTTQFISHWESVDHIVGWQFKSAVATAKKWVPLLREKVDVVVVAYHGGFERDLQTGDPTEPLTGENEGSALLREVPGIDALITGHQHREIATISLGTPVTQPGEKGQTIGEITIDLSDEHKIIATDAQLISMADVQPAAKYVRLMTKLNDEVENWLDQEMGQINGDMRITDPFAARFNGHSYLTFINDVQMAATGATISGTALFNDDVLGYGSTVTMRQILNSYVYPNTLVVARVTGAELRQALERSASFFSVTPDGKAGISAAFSKPKVQYYNYDVYRGIVYEFDLRKPVGNRVTNLLIDGKPLSDEAKVDVALNQYRGMGGGGYDMFGPDKIVKEVQVDMTELIGDYFKSHPIVEAKQDHNFKIQL
ncbi:2',3'-cyclic-nucleotide 2'-phosphodiesterase [Secundilactobacillus oryzae JCM 18671]|uniref:2',3'-cyclic-nucleotide 2'-phosphodiesterase n=1 Tax=Secundilactobacillus oryzae JCM 18671 TaxID=1291743 RepID=A0A081BHZ0_9LACO|nr:bifunctional UDP-sugar hydrolase/5'-nucleotidase [Secundilactobacillus oryzae]GAK47658.1 2',3'-cyclic-nucleotide 2'-phosphodiesterase [Secundilactobacillus oryzae JCM 18671]